MLFNLLTFVISECAIIINFHMDETFVHAFTLFLPAICFQRPSTGPSQCVCVREIEKRGANSKRQSQNCIALSDRISSDQTNPWPKHRITLYYEPLHASKYVRTRETCIWERYYDTTAHFVIQHSLDFIFWHFIWRYICVIFCYGQFGLSES